MADENKTKENLIIDGYFFMTKEDAARALSEQKKIRFIEERIHYDRPEEVLEIYNKVIKESMFKTPIGLQYLKGLQDYLVKSDKVNRVDIYSIPVYPVASKDQKEKNAEKKREQKKQEKREKDKALFHFSIFLNIAMAIALVCMFWIAIASPNANMINYEKAITNQYAQWEQELTEREKALRERERELSTVGSIEQTDQKEQF